MKKILVITIAIFMCLAMTACDKQTGTYTANVKGNPLLYGDFTLTLTLKKDGTFTLKPTSEDNDLIESIVYKGTYEIEKSNDGSEYDTLILSYTEFSEIIEATPIQRTKKAKINTKGTRVEISNFYGESKIILKK